MVIIIRTNPIHDLADGGLSLQESLVLLLVGVDLILGFIVGGGEGGHGF